MIPSCKERTARVVVFFVVLTLAAPVLPGQSSEQKPAQQQQTQDVPDAPSATRPPQFPSPTVTPTPPPANMPPANTQPSDQPPPPPSPDITTVPPGGAPNVPGSARDELSKFVVTVNFVQVPVTVKDDAGHLVEGLASDNFSIYEDGVRQQLKFFTSDPFPLSAAVVVDLGMPETALRKVDGTLSALVGAFGQFDEVGVYTYAETVTKSQDFTAAESDQLARAVNRIKRRKNAVAPVPVTGGPLASGPTVNGHPVDPGAPRGDIGGQYRPEPRVMNDAILMAALDLAQRDRTRRRIIFVISDGREYRSEANFEEVKKVLLTNQIQVYAVGVGDAAMPLYKTANRIRIPGLGYADILPKYVNATGGQLYAELSSDAIEQAYSRITSEARNQYTLGYTTRATPSSTYRSIEVRVDRPGLRVVAKDGYYPLPPGK